MRALWYDYICLDLNLSMQLLAALLFDYLVYCIPVSDDDEIDYSIKPEFYDESLDDKDQLWAQNQRSSYFSDAVLSCPACFTTLCLESQR